MFDDTPNPSQPGAPANLPAEEPEDMFANTGDVPEIPSALSNGLLKPKAPPSPDVPPALPVEIPPVATPAPAPVYRTPPATSDAGMNKMPEMYNMKEPVLSRVLLTVLLVVVIGGAVGVGGWFAYGKFFAKSNVPGTTPIDSSAGVVTDGSEVTETVGEYTTPQGPVSVEPVDTTDVARDITDDRVLFGETVDSDADGLDDVRETDIGTDPKNWDTDKDSLSDYNEVVVWKTDPFRPDTDGDGFTDGTEVTKGYSPTGPGKLFQPPTSTAPTSAEESAR